MRAGFYFFLWLAVATEPNWQTFTTPHFQIHYLPSSQGHLPRLEKELEGELGRVAALLKSAPPERIRVVFAPDEKWFLALQEGSAPPWASGMAYPERSLIYLRPLTAAEVRHSSLRAVIAHELSHILLFQRLHGQPAPTWLDEGMAVFVSAEPLYDRAERLVVIGLTGRALNFRDLESGFPQRPDLAAMAYAQAGNFIHFLYSEFGAEAVEQFLDELAAGRDRDEALKAAFHATLFDLELRWLRSVRWTYGLIPALSGGSLLWFLIALLGIAAYVRKKAETRRKRELWAWEEGLFTPGSLGEERVPGRREVEEEDDEEEDDDEEPFRRLH